MDILDEGRKLAEDHTPNGGFKGKLNAYECDGVGMMNAAKGIAEGGCGSFIVTIDRDMGVTPFMLKCGNCGGVAHSKMYRVQGHLTPTHEWYRPDTLDGIDERVFEHLSKGGIILRPIGGQPDRWSRPASKPNGYATAEDMRRKMQSAIAMADEMKMEKKLTPQLMSRQVRRQIARKVVK